MSNLFHSAEIRWFTREREPMASIFEGICSAFGQPFKFMPERTDHYLNTGLDSTGVKIREGNHEIKVKREDDTLINDIGRIENWSKWSSGEELNILNTINESHLKDWIPVRKKRALLVFEITKKKDVIPTADYVDDGCGVEFTSIVIGNELYYTFGLEAFATNNSETENLVRVWQHLNLRKEYFNTAYCMSYPEFLKLHLKD